MTAEVGERYVPAAKHLFYQSIPFMSRPFALLSAVIAALALPASAQKPRVVVVPFAPGEGASEAAASKFTNLVVDELKSRADAVEVVAPPSLKAAPAPEKGGKRSGGPSPDAVAALDAGKKAFEDLRFEDATNNLKKGIEGLLADPATADFEAIIDAHVKLAAAYFRMGEEKDAKTALLDLARLSPQYQLPPGYPPVFVREFDKAKKRLDKQPRGQVSIEGPGGATAFLDGRDLGMVPVLEENVPAGAHYVKVEGGKGERFGQVVDVKGALVKVKASFGAERAPVERAPVNAVQDPKISATVDDGTKERLTGYANAVKADFALVGYVYRTSDTQLTAGTALFAVKKGLFAALAPVSFDTDVLTANTESFKLCDELVKRTGALGGASALPLNLASKVAKTGTGVAKVDTKAKNPDDVEAVTPTSKKVVLVPKDDTRKLDNTSTPIDLEKKDDTTTTPPGGEVKKGGVPVWVWIVAGAAVAAGAGVGGYFGYQALTKPVTGTVTATW